MKAIIQRVSEATCIVEDKAVGEIEHGYLILLGISNADSDEDLKWLAQKIVSMRIFDDDAGLMNKSLLDVDGDILLISQFTLMAQTKKGNRPSFIAAARPDLAEPLYEKMIKELTVLSKKQVASGIFGADMKIHLVNDGPVTIIVDTKNKE